MSGTFKLIEVTDKITNKQFLNFPSKLYKNDENWVRYLDAELEKVFNPKQNKSFKTGELIRWILKDKNQVIGRIAAFYDTKSSEKEDQPTGGIGFFDCINNQEAANLMFDTAKQWLISKGMEAMDGPVNFGSREHFWGCLKEGFYEPVYNMPYNFEYYNDLLENYGFQNYFNQFTYHTKLKVGLIDPKITQNAMSLKKDEPDISFGLHNKKNPEKSADYFLEVFNAAWAKFPGVKPLSKKHANALFNSLKQVIDPKLLIFAFHKERPIAFFLMIPDLNPIIKKFNGKFHIFNKLRLLFDLKVRKMSRRALGLIFGVVPEFQGKKITDGMINYFEEEVGEGVQYTDLEMNWIGDFNPKMIKLVKSLNADVRKVHVTYRYLFDRNKEFKRAKIM
ncbi:MAG: hypothetical protein C0595_02770 [Marinilabiliales bacterium]|nr:MAG: hypothetical protein C0595_02770 [Marinilabiliales bacterium]